jgi:hypothetical protein
MTMQEALERLRAPPREPFRLDAECDGHLPEHRQENQFFRAIHKVAPQAIKELAEWFPFARLATNIATTEWRSDALEGGCIAFPCQPEELQELLRPAADQLLHTSRDVLSTGILHWAYHWNLTVWPRTEREYEVWLSRDIVHAVEASVAASKTAVRRRGRSSYRIEEQLAPHLRLIARAGDRCKVAGRWILRAVVRRFVSVVLPPKPCPLNCQSWPRSWLAPPIDSRYEWLVRSQLLRQSASEIGVSWAEDERRRMRRAERLTPPSRRTIDGAVTRLRARLDLPTPEPLRRGRKPRVERLSE